MNLGWDEMVQVEDAGGDCGGRGGAEDREVTCLETSVDHQCSRWLAQKVAGHLAFSSAVSLAV